jgi:hypothetical protein
VIVEIWLASFFDVTVMLIGIDDPGTALELVPSAFSLLEVSAAIPS